MLTLYSSWHLLSFPNLSQIQNCSCNFKCLCHYISVFFSLWPLPWPLLMAFCSWQCHTSTCCFIHCSVLCHLLCDALPFNITVTCRRAAYPRPAICVCLCASDCFLIRKTLIYNLPCSLQCALQYCLSSLCHSQDLCWLALTEGAACCAGWKGASAAAAAGVGDGGCFTHEVTRGFLFPLFLTAHWNAGYFLDSYLLLPSIQRAMFDAWSAWKMMLLCYMLKHMK